MQASAKRKLVAAAVLWAGLSPISPGCAETTKTVFIGATIGLLDLAITSHVQSLTASDRIGLLLHGAEPNLGLQAISREQRDALLAAWHLTGVKPEGGGQAVAEVGCTTEAQDAALLGYRLLFGAAGEFPVEVNMNCISGDGSGSGTYTATRTDTMPGKVYSGYVTSGDLRVIQSSMREFARYGAMNFAIFSTPNNPARDFDDPFSSSPYYENDRRAALLGGGIALDVPVMFFIQHPLGELYRRKIIEIIRWAVANQLRVSLCLSPWSFVPDQTGNEGDAAFDPDIVDHVRAIVTTLQHENAVPNQFIIYNYANRGSPNQPASDLSSGSLNQVALYLASVPVPSQGKSISPITGVSAFLLETQQDVTH